MLGGGNSITTGYDGGPTSKGFLGRPETDEEKEGRTILNRRGEGKETKK